MFGIEFGQNFALMISDRKTNHVINKLAAEPIRATLRFILKSY